MLITLLSDFGSNSPYPAAMKAVVATCCDPTFLDITHDVPRHDVRAGAYLLSTVAPHTPAGTVHLAVVDPGVGTARRPLIVASGGQFFVGPDNGLLMPAAQKVGAPSACAVTDAGVLRGVRAGTFHGRDLFAPVAGLLVRGTPPEMLGVPISDPVPLDFGMGTRQGTTLVGEIIYTDPFGNLITNIPATMLGPERTRVTVRAGARVLPAAVAGTYGEVVRGRAAVVPGSDGFVEVSVREGSARHRLGVQVGSVLRIVRVRSSRGGRL